MSARPRFLSARTLGFAAATSLLAVVALAVSSGDALVDHGFETAFAAAGRTTGPTIADASSGQPSQDLWLTGHDGTPASAHVTSSRIGERITMAVDGGPPVELEVIAVAEIATPMPALSGGTSASRLVMVTCRETGRESGGRIVRVILDGNEPLPGRTATGPSRAL